MKLTDNWFTALAEDESGATVIMNGRLELDAFRQSGKLPYRIEIRLPYEADGLGMPTPAEEPILADVEERLKRIMEKDKLAILTGNHLGGGTKYWVFYARNHEVFFDRLNEALEDLDELPLEFIADSDPTWSEYADMLTHQPVEMPEE